MNFSNTGNNDEEQPISLNEHPWIHLANVGECEAWLALNDHELQQLMSKQKVTDPFQRGQGICLSLLHGGEIFIHTNGDGDILLDVTSDAEWASPVISACSQIQKPKGDYWLLPNDVLVQLIMGLNPLIASSKLVLQHRFRF